MAKKSRHQRAGGLVALLLKGPALTVSGTDETLSREQIKQRFAVWIETWVLDDLMELVPELRGLVAGREQGFGYLGTDIKTVRDTIATARATGSVNAETLETDQPDQPGREGVIVKFARVFRVE